MNNDRRKCAGCAASTDANNSEDYCPSCTMSDKQTDAQGELSLIELLESCKPNYGDVGSRDVDVAAKRITIDEAIRRLRIAGPEFSSGGFFRATEGQAQTSAALPRIAGESGFELLLEGYREFGDKGNRKSNLLGFIHAWYKHHAAQLADSTAPGAPVEETIIGCGNPESFFAEFCEVQGYPSDGEMDAALRSAFYNGIQYCAMQPKYAAPTSQQSLTTGGAVPDEQWLIEKAGEIFNFKHWKTDEEQRARYVAFASAVLEFAAAPLPQVQSEGLDAAIDAAQEVIDDCDRNSEAAEEMGARRVLDAILALVDQQSVTPSGALADNDGGVA